MSDEPTGTKHDDPSAPDPFVDLTAYVALPRVSGLALSPSGDRLVTTLATLAPDATSYVTALWGVDPAGVEPAQRLTWSVPGETSPVFLPGGDVLFASRRPDPTVKDADTDKPALWLLPGDGGEARPVASRPGGVAAVAVAADTGTVVLLSPTLPGGADKDADEARRKARKEAGTSAILHESAPVRHWDHDLGPAQLQLFTAPAPAADGSLGDLRPLTPDPDRALDDETFVVTPDGREVVVGWNTQRIPGLPQARLVSIDVESGAQRVLADAADAAFSALDVSPDGRWVVALRWQVPTYDDPPEQGLWLVDLTTGEGRALAADLDLWPVGAVFAPDSGSVFFTADQDGRSPVFSVGLADGVVTRLAADGSYTDLCPSPDGEAVFALRATMDHPPAVVRLDARATDQEAVLLRGPGLLDAVPGRVDEVTATAEDGTALRSWLVLPPGASAAEPAPLVLWIHGGPLGSWNGWSWRWNPYLLAARGYAVLLPDPALSTGYGMAMVRRGWGQWGGTPYTDLMTITDAALERADVDASRVAAMGGSYGGYMANWVAGHTDRFSAIVTHASLWALDGFQSTTDTPAYWALEWGSFDERPERYQQYSPHLHLDNIRTPMLVVHGDKDYRVPLGEGHRLWNDLVRKGVEAKFLYFPDENHWVLKPGNARVWYETVLAFLAQHVLGDDWARPELL